LLRKAAEGTQRRRQVRLSSQFAVDTIQKHKIQPPGVTGWNDAGNSEGKPNTYLQRYMVEGLTAGSVKG